MCGDSLDSGITGHSRLWQRSSFVEQVLSIMLLPCPPRSDDALMATIQRSDYHQYQPDLTKVSFKNTRIAFILFAVLSSIMNYIITMRRVRRLLQDLHQGISKVLTMMSSFSYQNSDISHLGCEICMKTCLFHHNILA